MSFIPDLLGIIILFKKLPIYVTNNILVLV